MTSAVRTCLVAVALTAAIGAGCGDDDEPRDRGSTTSTAAEAALLAEDVPPQAAAPNVKGGDAPVQEFARKFGADAVEYFRLAFERNGKRYRAPAIVVLDRPGENGCGEPFDPERAPYVLCLASAGDRVTLGAPYLERAREASGDIGAVFLVGYGVALSAYDQLTGDRMAKGQQVDDEFVRGSVCLVGAWGRYMSSKKLLDADDDAELLKIAEDFIPGRTEEGVSLGQDFLALGFSEGAKGCTQEAAQRG